MSSIFDFIKNQSDQQTSSSISPPRNSSSIFQIAKDLPEEKEVSRIESLTGAPLKGLLKGLSETAEGSPFVSRGPVSHEMFQKLTNEVLQTRDKAPEKFLERAGRISSYAIGPGKALSKAIKGTVATVGGQIAENLGFSKEAQSAIEAGAFLTPTVWKGAQKYVSSLYNKADTLLSKDASINSRTLKNSIRTFMHDLRRGGTAPSKNLALKKAEEIEKKALSGRIDVKELTEFKKTINEARSGLYTDKELTKAGRKEAKRNLDRVSSIVDKSLEEYGKTNPQWYNTFKEANEGFGAIANSKRVSNWVANVVKQNPHIASSGVLGSIIGHALVPGSMLKGIAGLGAGYSAVKAGEFVARIYKSKVLRKYYKDMIQAAMEENRGAFINNLRKLGNHFKSEEDEKD